MIEIMLKGISLHHDVRFVRMEFSDSVSTAGKFALGKIAHLFGLICRTLKALGFRRDRYLYYPPASPNLIPVVRDILFLLVVRPFSKGLILQFHAGGVSRYAGKHPVLRPFLQLAYGRMSLGIVQGASCPDDPAYFRAKKRAIIPYGIDLVVEANARTRLESDVLRIVYVGIHTEDKGLFSLLETARELSSHGVGFIMHTVGKWYAQEEEDRFLKMRHEYGLDEMVVCLGQRTGGDLWQAYAWADVFFFPTKYPWETMGIVQLEAMAHGIPVVASDWQGPKDVVLDGETGFLCPHNQPNAFADRLALLAKDEEQRKRMGKAGRERYKSFYTEKCFIDRLEAAFKALK
jgi:glycosyltransferase involved in cell wall biosynthesis